MRELPIIFSSRMVNAIRGGIKTQTRRIVKSVYELGRVSEEPDKWKFFRTSSFGEIMNSFTFAEDVNGRGLWISKFNIDMPRVVGDRLWVRESFTEVDGNIIYRADIPDREWNNYKWRPSIFMKKEYAREWLEIQDVSLEKLQDINQEDVIAEGFETLDDFIKLWDSLNEKKGFAFEKNPLVWVVTFNRVKRR